MIPPRRPYCCLDHALANADLDPKVPDAVAWFERRPSIPRWCGQVVGTHGSMVLRSS